MDMMQGAQSRCSDGVGRKKDGFKRREYTCARGRFMVMYGKEHHNVVKQITLLTNNNKKIKKSGKGSKRKQEDNERCP